MEKEINIAYNRIEDLKRLNFIESAIKKLDKKDPVKFDFSLCRFGMVEN